MGSAEAAAPVTEATAHVAATEATAHVAATEATAHVAAAEAAAMASTSTTASTRQSVGGTQASGEGSSQQDDHHLTYHGYTPSDSTIVKDGLGIVHDRQLRLRASFRSNIRAWKCVRDDIGAIKLIVRIQLSSGPETGRNEQRAGQGHVCCE
jgi:hypothetical protein